MADEEGFQTRKNYYNYKYAKTHKGRVKAAAGIVTILLALAAAGNGIYSSVNAKKTSANIDEVSAQIQVLEENLYRTEDEALKQEYSQELDYLNQERDYDRTIKQLDVVNASASFGSAAILLFLGKFLIDLISGETDKRKKKFYQDFLDEITFINDESSYRSLDYLIFRVIDDAAAINKTTTDDLLAEIHKDEVFPEFTLSYDNLLAYIDNFVRTTDYKKINPAVYNSLPFDYIQFAAFLKRKGINIASFRRVPYEKAVELMEEFLDGIFEEDKNKGKNLSEVAEAEPIK